MHSFLATGQIQLPDLNSGAASDVRVRQMNLAKAPAEFRAASWRGTWDGAERRRRGAAGVREDSSGKFQKKQNKM